MTLTSPLNRVAERYIKVKKPTRNQRYDHHIASLCVSASGASLCWRHGRMPQFLEVTGSCRSARCSCSLRTPGYPPEGETSLPGSSSAVVAGEQLKLLASSPRVHRPEPFLVRNACEHMHGNCDKNKWLKIPSFGPLPSREQQSRIGDRYKIWRCPNRAQPWLDCGGSAEL